MVSLLLIYFFPNLHLIVILSLTLFFMRILHFVTRFFSFIFISCLSYMMRRLSRYRSFSSFYFLFVCVSFFILIKFQIFNLFCRTNIFFTFHTLSIFNQRPFLCTSLFFLFASLAFWLFPLL